MTLLGEVSLWGALLMAAWTVIVSFGGGMLRRPDLIRSGERATYTTACFTLLAVAGVLSALWTQDFSLRLVASHTSVTLPRPYRLTALWAGASGSLLLWGALLTMVAAIAVFSHRRTQRHLMPWVTGTLGVFSLFVIVALCFGDNPYERLDWALADGRGLMPALQQPLVAIYPPLLYLGLVASVVPCAFAVAALITQHIDAAWIASVRRWSLISWLPLTVGIVLSMRWAYGQADWGGLWSWDAVQNASLVPWLTGTAFLHSLLVQERRGTLGRWNVTLLIVTGLLVMLGAFITRSGAVTSIHAFSRSAVGPWFLGFVIVAAVVAAFFVATRLPQWPMAASEAPVESREGTLLLTSVMLVAIASATLWGTVFPLVSTAVTGKTLTLGMRYFNTINGALGALLLSLAGAAIVRNVLQRRRVAGSQVASIRASDVALASAPPRGRDRRRYGSYLVHTGIIALLCAVAGLPFRTSASGTLKTGETLTAVDAYGHAWTFTSQGLSTGNELNWSVVAVNLSVARDGVPMGLLSSEQREYVDGRGEPIAEPYTTIGLRSSPRQDVSLRLQGAIDKDTATVRVDFNPLMWWVWLGGALMLVGGAVVMWPATHPATQPAKQPTRVRMAVAP